MRGDDRPERLLTSRRKPERQRDASWYDDFVARKKAAGVWRVRFVRRGGEWVKE